MSELVWVEVTVKAETDAALLVDAGMDSDAWIQKSQITDYSDDYKIGDSIEIEIAQWLAEDKGIV